MPSGDTCCGCIELRTGCLIIAYIILVLDIIFAGLLGFYVAVSGIKAVVALGMAQLTEDDKETMSAIFMAASVILLLIVLFLFVFTIVLLVGLHQKKRGHLKAYLIYSYIVLVFSVIGLFASFKSPFDSKDLIYKLVGILIDVYFTLVIQSYYHKIGENRPQIYNTQHHFVGKPGFVC